MSSLYYNARDFDVQSLRQAFWDVYTILGFDTDGDPTPAAVVNLCNTVVTAAKNFRDEYDDLLEELEYHDG